MSDYRQSFKREKDDDKDDPPMSRLFIICNKANTEEDVRKAFEKFGVIEKIWVVKDKITGDNKGVVYVKYNKTSSAAKALEEMHGKVMGAANRTIKVLVASSRNQGSSRSENEHEKYVRLFVLVPKDMTEEELTHEFEKYGELESISVIKDKITKERKGFAYIKYNKFSHAALAFEGCSNKFKAVFAEPKSSARNNNQNDRSDKYHRFDDFNNRSSDFMSSFNTRSSDYNFNTSGNSSGETQLNIICSTTINQDQLWRLFDIIPGLDYCQITGEGGRSNYATAVYNNTDAAQYAREKLHGLEYPPGERIIIKLMTDPKSNTGNIFSFENGPNKDFTCSITLPDPAPIVSSTSPCLQRCFIVCVQKPLPSNILVDVFCRFNNLIDVYLLPNKNCGYAKYASEESANAAIDVLHGAEINGVRLKVLEAEEPTDAKRKRYEQD